MTVPEATRKARSERGLTLDAFGDALVEKLHGYSFTRQAVFSWEKGKTAPDFQFLLLCSFAYADWRRTWALNCLAAIRPEVFAPAEQVSE